MTALHHKPLLEELNIEQILLLTMFDVFLSLQAKDVITATTSG